MKTRVISSVVALFILCWVVPPTGGKAIPANRSNLKSFGHFGATSEVRDNLSMPGYWVMEAPVPVPRESDVVIAYDNYLYVLGGYGSGGSSYRYDPLSDTWTQLATTDFELEFLEDGCLGYNYRGEPIIAIFPNMYSDYDTMLFYNIIHDWWGWGYLPEWIGTFFDIASDPEHNVCYITGGQATFMPENRFYAYYPATNSIEQLPSFTTGRYTHASWFIPQWGEAGYVCIAGGHSTTLFALNSTQCYDIAQGVWHAENEDLGPLPHRWWLMADALKFVEGVPQLWLLGGTIGPDKTNKTAYYDVEQGEWVAGPHLPYAISEAEADTLGNEIYVVGGNEDYRSTAYNQHHIREPLPTCTEELVLFDDFEGEQYWTPSGKDSLWHAEPQDGVCGALVAPFPSPSTAWYYGDQVYGCTYNTPGWYGNYGYLTLDTMIPITGARYAGVRFWSYEQTECGDGNIVCNDARSLEVSYDGGATWTYLYWGTTEERWYTATESTHVDPGNSLRLRFHFTTSNTNWANDYLGWFIDNVEVTACYPEAQTWFEEDDPAITYTGRWKPVACPQCSGGAQQTAGRRGAAAEFSFEGTGVRWYLTKARMLGKARVYLDGVDLGFVDLYSPTPQYQQVWETTGLAPGAHTLKIEVSGKKHPRSRGRAITLDALEVMP